MKRISLDQPHNAAAPNRRIGDPAQETTLQWTDLATRERLPHKDTSSQTINGAGLFESSVSSMGRSEKRETRA